MATKFETQTLSLLRFHVGALLAALPRCRCGALATRRWDIEATDPPGSPACDLHAGHPQFWPELPHAASARAVQAALDALARPAEENQCADVSARTVCYSTNAGEEAHPLVQEAKV